MWYSDPDSIRQHLKYLCIVFPSTHGTISCGHSIMVDICPQQTGDFDVRHRFESGDIERCYIQGVICGDFKVDLQLLELY